MNILFTTSAEPELSPFFTSEKRPPLGMGCLMSIVRDAGHEIFFIDNYLEPSNFIEEDYLQSNAIDIVAIYANTICYRDTLRMFNEINTLRTKGSWQGKIIVGGPHTSVALDTIPDFVDHIVQGEGELAILEIVGGQTNERVINSESTYELDSLPFQPWDIFNKLPYDFSCNWMDVEPVFTMNTSRGCPFKCTFCSVNSVWGKSYRYYNTERIISEIQFLIDNYDAKGIYFREDHFTLNVKRTKEFCHQMIEQKIPVSWACETRVDRISEDLVQLMSEARCKAVYLGVESGSQRILDKLKKGITVEQIENAVNLFHKYKIRVYCSLITGIPGETFEDYRLTRDLMSKLKPYSHSYGVFVGIPDSPLYEEVLTDKSYEYEDEIGLLYMPGYDIKARYFYNSSSQELVNYKFKQRTAFDRDLMKDFPIHYLKGFFPRVASKMGRMFTNLFTFNY